MTATAPHPLLQVARDALTAQLAGEPYSAPKLGAPYDVPRAVFVTLWRPDGGLRGCIGHLTPVRDTVAEEVAVCAVSAGLRDPRFGAVTLEEMAGLSFEVTLLNPSEPIGQDTTQLDPKIYGVVVTCGRRRGVLLPGVKGVDTVAKQLSIAMRKGRIASHEKWQLARFTSEKITP